MSRRIQPKLRRSNDVERSDSDDSASPPSNHDLQHRQPRRTSPRCRSSFNKSFRSPGTESSDSNARGHSRLDRCNGGNRRNNERRRDNSGNSDGGGRKVLKTGSDAVRISRDEPRGTPKEEQIVYRDEEGRRIDKEQWQKLKFKKKNEKRDPRKNPAPELTWGGGIVQQENKEAAAAEAAKIAAAPFARHEIDQEYDKELQEQHRWEDPMANYLESNSEPESAAESVPMSTQIPKPMCRFTAPPNRYNIPAGYRWDGIVRGNGFEAKRFNVINTRKMQEDSVFSHNWEDE